MKLQTLKPRVQVIGNSLPVVGSWRDGRTSSTARGYTYRWQQERAAYLREHPLCQCPACDDGRLRVMVATVVDHKVPHRGDMTLFWDQSNWQAMNKECHDAKTGGGE